MSDTELDMQELEAQCSDVDIDTDSPVLIACSCRPEALLAGAALARAITNNGGIFHVTFSEALMPSKEIDQMHKIYPEHNFFLVGIHLVGKTNPGKDAKLPVLIGCDSGKQTSSIIQLGTQQAIGAAAYTLARNLFSATDEALTLAVASSLYHRTKISGASQTLLEKAKSDGVVEIQTGYRLFGSNFLPLSEMLLYSIRPYLDGITGSPESCVRILEEANLSLAARSGSLTALDKADAQKLTEQLAIHLSPSVLSGGVLGQDYLFHSEDETSPLRFLSGCIGLTEVALCRGELGRLFSVFLGDRARLIKTLLDVYVSHCKQVISDYDRLPLTKDDYKTKSESVIETLSLKGFDNCTLGDLGRITLELGALSGKAALSFNTEGSIVVTLSDRNYLHKLIYELHSTSTPVSMLSSTSLLVEDPSNDLNDRIVDIIEKIYKESTQTEG